jgi:hypothetical protein
MKAGQIKVYAVTAKNRIAMAPDVPTTDEADLPGFYFSFWHAIWAPKGTPKEFVAKLNGALREALANPETRKRLVDIAQEIFCRRKSKRQKRYEPSSKPRSTSGGRSSRRRASRRNNSCGTALAGGAHGRASPTRGRQTRRRFSISVTTKSITITKVASTNMPANTPATSNTPSACWIR